MKLSTTKNAQESQQQSLKQDQEEPWKKRQILDSTFLTRAYEELKYAYLMS